MVEWLLKKDEYCPPADRDSFIAKSSLSILSILSRVRRGGNPGKGVLYSINPTLKLSFTLIIIIFLSLSHSLPYIMTVYAYIFLEVSLLELKDIWKTFVLAVTVAIFSTLILLPSIVLGNGNSLQLLLKITGSVVMMNTLASSSKWSHITRSMKVFRIPDIFVLVLDITIKYIVILGEFSMQMLTALELRSIGRNNRKYQSISNLIGCLFLKSKEMSELTYSAMECRGFDGTYSIHRKNRIKAADIFYIAVNICVILAYFSYK